MVIVYVVDSPDIDDLRKATDNHFTMVHRDLERVNDTVAELQATASQMKKDFGSLDRRLKVIESQPQEKLIKQVDSIHHEVNTND